METSINWFSPLPPDRSGIAEFTAALAPVLRQRAAVRFFAQGSRETGERRFAEAESAEAVTAEVLNRADLNVFNLGNNATFHDVLWRLSCRSGGIVVLHDFRLQHLFGGLFLHKSRDPGAYLELMRETYGIEGEAAARLMVAGRAKPELVSELFPLVEAGLRGAAGVIVHTDEALSIVRERSRVPVCKLNLPYEAGDAPRRAAPSMATGRGVELVAFGHIGPNRRIESVLRAIARIEPVAAVRLHLIGDLWNERLVRQLVRDLRLDDAVVFHGHLSDAELDARLATADVAVNLRWPTMGEASYSQLRAWHNALPTLVTRTGWYAELPEDAVIHIAPGDEVEQVAAAIERCRSNPVAFAAVGARGRLHLERFHRLDAYVDGLVRFAAGLPSFGVTRRGLAHDVARQLAALSPAAAECALASANAALRGLPA